MSEHPDHYIAKCKHGVVTAQCRCASRQKHEVLSECPEICKDRTEINEAEAEAWFREAIRIDDEEGEVHAARAALAWKARADELEREMASLKRRNER